MPGPAPQTPASPPPTDALPVYGGPGSAAAPAYPPQTYDRAAYSPPGPMVPTARAGRSSARVLVVVVVLVIVLAVGGAVAYFAFGPGQTGQCVGVSYNGSYYDYTREYGMTQSQCDSWCASHSFGTSCYWQP
jgi:hypothetical protein